MKPFNENPFLKDTPVIPFRQNGEVYRVWGSNNCSKCIKYERKSETPDEAGCELEYYISLGTITSEIPLWVAKEIGCTYDPLYQRVDLFRKCRKFDNGDMPF